MIQQNDLYASAVFIYQILETGRTQFFKMREEDKILRQNYGLSFRIKITRLGPKMFDPQVMSHCRRHILFG